MRRFSILAIFVTLTMLLLGCNDTPPLPTPLLTPSAPVNIEVTNPPLPANNTPVANPSPVPNITPELATPVPNPSGLQLLQYDYYGDDIAINFVGTVKNNTGALIEKPVVMVALKDIQGNVVATATDTLLSGFNELVSHGNASASYSFVGVETGQTIGFHIQLFSAPPGWATAEISTQALSRNASVEEKPLLLRPDIKVSDDQMTTDSSGRNIIAGQFIGEKRSYINIYAIIVAYDGTGKVVDVSSAENGTLPSDTFSSERKFTATLQRSGVKVARYDFSIYGPPHESWLP